MRSGENPFKAEAWHSHRQKHDLRKPAEGTEILTRHQIQATGSCAGSLTPHVSFTIPNIPLGSKYTSVPTLGPKVISKTYFGLFGAPRIETQHTLLLQLMEPHGHRTPRPSLKTSCSVDVQNEEVVLAGCRPSRLKQQRLTFQLRESKYRIQAVLRASNNKVSLGRNPEYAHCLVLGPLQAERQGWKQQEEQPHRTSLPPALANSLLL